MNLEKAVIRAAAVSALAAFAHKVPGLKKNILILLQKCLTDSDDEVRERAYFYIRLLEEQGDHSVLEQELASEAQEDQNAQEEKDDFRNFLFDTNNMIDVDALEHMVCSKKDELLQNEDGLSIDLSNFLVSKKSAQQRKVFTDPHLRESQQVTS